MILPEEHRQLIARLLNLDNSREVPDLGISQGDEDMPKRLRERVQVNGKEKWVSGANRQALYDAYVGLLVDAGLIEWVDEESLGVPLFHDYMDEFYKTYKQKQEQNTTVNRHRIIKNHIDPRWGNKHINKIRTPDLQKWFDDLALEYANETILKIKNTMSPVFDAAVEEGIILRNPLKSTLLEIGGKETVPHKALPKEKMQEIKQALPFLEGNVQIMATLLSYTGMRFEEVLGLRWEDFQDDWIMIRRAVVHPKRNMPIIKDTKTKSSDRIIPFFPEIKQILSPNGKKGFLLHSSKDPTGETPMSYSEARRVFEKIRKQFDIKKYTAHDFRDTCATEWREAGIQLDVIARLLGHAKTETTERKYVKYRPDLLVTSCDTSNTQSDQVQAAS